MKPGFIIILFLLLDLHSNVVSAQVNLQDSLALVDFYEFNGGEEWVNNGNWLNGPIQTWAGITLDPGGQFVTGINLISNNIVGEIPQSILDLTQLQMFNIENNDVTFIPNLLLIPAIQQVNVQFNQLGFDSFEPYFEFGAPPILFEFQNQKPIGIEIDTIVGIGTTMCLPNYVGGEANNYQWFQNGVLIDDGVVLTDGSLKLPIQHLSQTAEYFVEVTNEIVPGVQLFGFPILLQIAQTDSIGGLIKPRQLIVMFQNGIHPDTVIDIRNEFSASKLDSILCNDIELWGLPDTVFLPGGDTLIEIEEIKSRAAAKSKVEEVNYNHIVERVDGRNGKITAKKSEIKKEDVGENGNHQSITDDTIIVAVVDTGIDTLHSLLESNLWQNTGETYSNMDQDGNCIPDDVRGYNFEAGSTHIVDDNGHGTHVAGIITQLQAPGNHVSLISLRTHDDKGRGDIFAMMSAIFYAGSKGARVINISSGYYGEASTILEIAIREAEKVSQSVVVTSSGNSAKNNDSIPHYPSSFRLTNLISVAALNVAEDGIAFYSNYGRATVDIAAPGSEIVSTLPGNLSGEKSGSSMAAAWASGQLANVILNEPELTAEQIISCTKMNAAFIVGSDTSLVSQGKIDTSAAISCLNAIVPAMRMRIWLEGPYQPITGIMAPFLFNQSLLPLIEPFSDLGWPLTEGSGETMDPTLLTHPPIEWGILELRDGTDSSMLIYQRPVVIQSNGQVVLPSGDSVLIFTNASIDEYFVALRFMSHLDVLTPSTITYDRRQPQVDGTSYNSSISNSNIFFEANGQAVLFGGDANSDNIVDAADRSATWNHRNEVGYLSFDVNLDGTVDASDRSNTWNNRNKVANFPQ